MAEGPAESAALVSERIARRLAVLYGRPPIAQPSQKAPLPSKCILTVAGLLDAPSPANPSIATPATSDHQVMVSIAVLKDLHLIHGSWVAVHASLSPRRCIIAQIVTAVPGQPPDAQLQGGALLSPLAAFNLGLPYQLAPLILDLPRPTSPAQAAGGGNAPEADQTAEVPPAPASGTLQDPTTSSPAGPAAWPPTPHTHHPPTTPGQLSHASGLTSTPGTGSALSMGPAPDTGMDLCPAAPHLPSPPPLAWPLSGWLGSISITPLPHSPAPHTLTPPPQTALPGSLLIAQPPHLAHPALPLPTARQLRIAKVGRPRSMDPFLAPQPSKPLPGPPHQSALTQPPLPAASQEQGAGSKGHPPTPSSTTGTTPTPALPPVPAPAPAVRAATPSGPGPGPGLAHRQTGGQPPAVEVQGGPQPPTEESALGPVPSPTSPLAGPPPPAALAAGPGAAYSTWLFRVEGLQGGSQQGGGQQGGGQQGGGQQLVSPWAAVDVISQPMSIQPLDGTEVSLVGGTVNSLLPLPGTPGLGCLGSWVRCCPTAGGLWRLSWHPCCTPRWKLGGSWGKLGEAGWKLGGSRWLAAYLMWLAAFLRTFDVACDCLRAGLSLGLQASVLLTGPPGSGKKTAGRAAAAALGLHCITTSCLELRGQTEAKTAAALTSLFKEASRYSPCLLLLTDLEELVGQRGAASATAHDLGQQRVADALQGGPPSLAALPTPAPAPTPPPPPPGLVLLLGLAKDLQDVAVPLGPAHLSHLPPCGKSGLSQPADLEQVSTQMAGLLPVDSQGVALDSLLTAAAPTAPTSTPGLASGQQMKPQPVALDAAQQEGLEVAAQARQRGQGQGQGQGQLRVKPDHLRAALSRVKQRTATEVGAPQVPQVKWEDIGGLEDVKQAILDTVELPLKHRHLFASGLRTRSGVLLYGPPGKGW
ncbi:hypothetical protein V8C86DRAFT_3177093, partial [Haematococcus lacustris]